MSEPSLHSRDYLDPRVLARVTSLELRARLIVEGLMAGMHRSPYHGISVEFAQHRPYAPGDDIRHVDWKVFGRSEKLYLKQYQQETNLDLICVVDASESMGFGSLQAQGKAWTKYDHATALAAALSYLAVRQQDSVGLAVFDEALIRYFKPSNSPGQWKLVVHELMGVPRWKKTSMGKVLDQLAEKLTHRGLVVVLSDFFDDPQAIHQGLRHLRYRKHEVLALQILDPQEIQFTFDDMTLFRGLEEAGQLLADPRALRRAYLQKLEAFLRRLKSLCRDMDVDYQLFNSAQSLEAPLGHFLATRAARMK